MNINILTLLKAGLIDDLDHHFSRFIVQKEKRTLSGAELNVIEIGCALISRQISKGNICLSEKDLEILKSEAGISGGGFPSWEEMFRIFKDAEWCSDGAEPKPVVFDGERFYLYRYWNYEKRLASAIMKMSEEKSMFSQSYDDASEMAENMFKNSSSGTLKLNAVQGVFRNRFNVITGGPGTGKTTVIAKIISILWKLFPDSVVRLAAPTGKAAARINESLSRVVEQMQGSIDPEISEKLKKLSGSSIHRLLGWTSKPGVFRHNIDNPVEADLLIVDEASMVDLAMMSLLLEAVKPDASIVLLGDKDQLTSVEAGNVLGDIFYAASFGYISSSTVTEFTESYRFKKGTGIGELANAVNTGISEEKMSDILKNSGDGAVYLIDPEDKNLIEQVSRIIVQKYSGISASDNNIEKVFEIFEKFRIICATRKGRSGVEEINRFAGKVLRKNGSIKSDDIWYHGRPVMVLENDYNLELYNGDCGLILEINGEKRAVFRGGQTGFRTFPVSVLPQIETVYAMTVHKSQGSEYDSVMIIFPDRDTPVLTKELVYTAVTRAKTQITIVSEMKLLILAASRSGVRSSGLVSAFKYYRKRQS